MTNNDNYLFIFGDLIGSTEVAAERSELHFAKNYIGSFYWSALKAMEYLHDEKVVFTKLKFEKIIDKYINFNGDEIISFTSLSCCEEDDEKIEDIVASAVTFAFVTQMFWLASDYNLKRLSDRQFPRDLAFGLHIGPASKVFEKSNYIAGMHINVAKRIEQQGHILSGSRIYSSPDVAVKFNRWHKRKNELRLPLNEQSILLFPYFVYRRDPINVKGITRAFRLLELVGPTSPHEFSSIYNFLMGVTLSFHNPDFETGKALSNLASIFMPNDNYPFIEENNDESMSILSAFDQPKSINNVKEYIDIWFSAIESQPMIFKDDKWLLFKYILISCLMLNHPLISQEYRTGHIDDCQRIVKSLDQVKDI